MQKILIVEDDIDIQDILKNHLIDAGYEVAVASDGVTGIAMFDDTIDLVLLDIMLPKIDGYGVCEVIRKRSQIPIIMLTALSDEENQLRGFEQQIDDYIPKPFSPKILLCKIAAILRRRTAENQNPSLLTYKELSIDVDGFRINQTENQFTLTSGICRTHKALHIFSCHQFFENSKLLFGAGRHLILPLFGKDREVCIRPLIIFLIVGFRL